jgi:tetratricopeptide (TPR) repeat protein
VTRNLIIGAAAVALTVGIIFAVSPEEHRNLSEIDEARVAIARGELDEARGIIARCKQDHFPCVGGDTLINAAERSRAENGERGPAQLPTPVPSHDAPPVPAGPPDQLALTTAPKKPDDVKANPLAPQPGDVVKNLTELGRNQLRAKDYTGAKKTFTDCTRIDPKAFECAKLLGSVYAKLEQPAESVKWYRKFLEIAPVDHADRSKIEEMLKASGR